MPKAKNKPLDLTDKQKQALSLVFEGRLTREQIAEKCSIAPRTLYTWLDHPDFASRLQEMRDNALDELLRRGVAYVTKEARVIALAQLAESARTEYEAHPILSEERPTRNGPATSETFNRDAFECFRGALDDIAKELGHRRPEKPEHDGSQVRIIIETDTANVALVQVTTDASDE